MVLAAVILGHLALLSNGGRQVTELTIDAIRKVIREETGKPASPWLDTSGAAAYLGSTPGTLKNWRAAGIGPAYHIMQERLVRYHADELDHFVRTGGR